MSTGEPTTVRLWMDSATQTFLDALDRVEPTSIGVPSPFLNWTVAEVVSHIHFNAVALRRLATWARTGVERPMYESQQQRTAEIAYGATLPYPSLRDMVRTSAARLRSDLDELSAEMWTAKVVTATGRQIPASEIVWLRTREVAIHAVDLGVGVRFDDLDANVLERLATEIVATRFSRGEGSALAAWLTGRISSAPELGPWL